MSKDRVVSPALAVRNGHVAQATLAAPSRRFVLISGTTAHHTGGMIRGVGGITAQTNQVNQDIKATVEVAGGALDYIAGVRYIADFGVIPAVRGEYFKKDRPAFAMVDVSSCINSRYLLKIAALEVVGADAL